MYFVDSLCVASTGFATGFHLGQGANICPILILQQAKQNIDLGATIISFSTLQELQFNPSF